MKNIYLSFLLLISFYSCRDVKDREFNKTVTVYCNTENPPAAVKVMGVAQ